MKIILFGGSFNPIHNGHLAIAQGAMDFLDADKVIFIPSKKARWKDKSDIQSKMILCKIALFDYPSFELDDFEINSDKEENFTIDTIRYFKKKYPTDELYFLLGSDQEQNFDKWIDPDKIANSVKLLCYIRPGYEVDLKIKEKYNFQILNLQTYNVSSTDIRNGKDLHIPLEAINYIIDNDLYFIPKVKEHYKEKRFKHAVSVANTAYRIALDNNIDPCKAFLASLYHDITKKMDDEEQRKLIDEFLPEFKNYPSYSLHQFSGMIITKEEFKIEDVDILNSIMYHTTGRENMSSLEKCIYVSDKVEPTREFDLSEIRELSIEDLDKGFIALLKNQQDYFNKNGVDPNENELTKEMYNYYLK